MHKCVYRERVLECELDVAFQQSGLKVSVAFFSTGPGFCLIFALPLFGFWSPSVGIYQIVGFAIIVHNVGGFYGERVVEVKFFN